jgi:hypothetical protein
MRRVHIRCFLLLLTFGPLAFGADSGQANNVLVLYSFHKNPTHPIPNSKIAFIYLLTNCG